MNQITNPELYEETLKYMPWGMLLDKVLDTLVEDTPENGRVLDMMCGTGHLANRLSARRSDLSIEAFDLDPIMIEYARKKNPSVAFQVADALEWKSDQLYDAVVCTGGVHHLAYDLQRPFLERIPNMLTDRGFALIADPYIDDFTNEEKRIRAAAKLGIEYVLETLKKNPPPEIIQAAAQILYQDVAGLEYKTSFNARVRQVYTIFQDTLFNHKVEAVRTWPVDDYAHSMYGEYIFICRK